MQLLCLGDVALAQSFLSDAVWAAPGGLMTGVETQVMFNWEFPLGEKVNSQPRESGRRFMAQPESIKRITNWAPGIATMATNHILDAGEEGLAGSIHALQKAGFRTVGAGIAPKEIAAPITWETAEGRLSIVNWVFAETHPDWMAVPGPNCWPGLTEARRTIQALKHSSDWVIVVVHWSDELFPFPLPADRATAQDLADMGADIVIGHHPHVVRGMELINTCPVFYSLGNFYFAEIKSKNGSWVSQEAPRNREGLGVKLSFQRGGQMQVQLLSFWNTGRETLLDPKCRAKKRLEWASASLRKFKNEAYADWYKTERARFDHWESRWHFGVMRRGVGGTLQRMITRLRKTFLVSS
jgi:poly-gamma-glutamate synthesis protein (capsule biosynthesis protein)